MLCGAVRVAEHAAAVYKMYEDKADALRTEFLRRSMRRMLTPVSTSTAAVLNNLVFSSLLYLGMRVSVSKTEVMISGERQKPVQKSAKWPCGVCGSGVGSNSIQCTSCHKWVHKKCSGIKGSMY